MWDIVKERIDLLVVLCTILAYVIPFTIYKINQQLHKKNNPPWKNDDKKNM